MMESPARRFAPLAALALSALLLFPFAARAQEPPPPGAEEESTPRPGRNPGELLARLNLSPEQRARIRAVRQQTELEARPLLQRLRRARRALDAAIYSDNADDAVVQERLREFNSAQADVAHLRALTELRVRRVLTPEQLAVLREMRRQARLAQRRRNARERRAGQSLAPDAPPPEDAFSPALRPRPCRGVAPRPRP